MYVSTQDRDTDAVLLGQLLQTQDQSLALFLVLVSSVVVVQIVQEIDTAIKLVEEATPDAETLVQEPVYC